MFSKLRRQAVLAAILVATSFASPQPASAAQIINGVTFTDVRGEKLGYYGVTFSLPKGAKVMHFGEEVVVTYKRLTVRMVKFSLDNWNSAAARLDGTVHQRETLNQGMPTEVDHLLVTLPDGLKGGISGRREVYAPSHLFETTLVVSYPAGDKESVRIARDIATNVWPLE